MHMPHTYHTYHTHAHMDVHMDVDMDMDTGMQVVALRAELAKERAAAASELVRVRAIERAEAEARQARLLYIASSHE